MYNNYEIKYLIIRRTSLIWNTFQSYILYQLLHIHLQMHVFIPRSWERVEKVVKWLDRFDNYHLFQQSNCIIILFIHKFSSFKNLLVNTVSGSPNNSQILLGKKVTTGILQMLSPWQISCLLYPSIKSRKTLS